MTLRPTLKTALAATAAAIATLAAAGAHATTLYAGPASMPEMGDNTSFDVTFNSLGAGAANLSFVLDGYASLDGQNWYEDDFTLKLNGNAIAKGTWNLGGGGNDVVYFAPLGATFNNVSGNGTAVTWAGGHVNVNMGLDLLAGANTLTFSYEALDANSGHAGWQPLGDEGWGAHDILVTQTARVGLDRAPGVPEPATWGLMIVGFAGLGAMLRRQRAATQAI